MSAAVTLYDARGKPVTPAVRKLENEQATGSIASIRTPYEELVAPGLTPRKLQDIIERATLGDHADYLQLAADIEKRDANYMMALQTRKLAVQSLERTVESASESAEDTAIAEAVKGWLYSEQTDAAIVDVLDATSKGFSVTEILWRREEERWTPCEYIHRPQRWFLWDWQTLRELRLVDGTRDGEMLEPYKFIVHAPRTFSGPALAGGLARVVMTLHMIKGYAMKDWLAFAEVFGMPLRVGRYEENASAEQIDVLKRAVRNIGSDAAAVIPNSMTIEFLKAQTASGGSSSDSFFQILASWCNREVNKAVLGSNLVDEDGGSFAKAIALNDLRQDLKASDASQLRTSLQRCVVRPFVDLNFGPRKTGAYPRVYFDTSVPEDLGAYATAIVQFIDRGLPVKIADVLDKFGHTLPEAGEAILRAMAKAAPADGNPDTTDGNATDGQTQAKVLELRAVLARVAREAERATNMRAFRRQVRDAFRLAG